VDVGGKRIRQGCILACIDGIRSAVGSKIVAREGNGRHGQDTKEETSMLHAGREILSHLLGRVGAESVVRGVGAVRGTWSRTWKGWPDGAGGGILRGPMAPARIFLLSPARLDGKRGALLFAPGAAFPVAIGLRAPEGIPIGHVYRFVSGLYFRGKLAYAERFARPPGDDPVLGGGVMVITPSRGLIPASMRVCLEHLDEFSQIDIHHEHASFRKPLVRDARAVRDALGPEDEIVLLGSIASVKYVDPLLEVLGNRLLFPKDFVGRGDMSRGGLMLRCAQSGTELPYIPVLGATRRGTRPPKLEPRRS